MDLAKLRRQRAELDALIAEAEKVAKVEKKVAKRAPVKAKKAPVVEAKAAPVKRTKFEKTYDKFRREKAERQIHRARVLSPQTRPR